MPFSTKFSADMRILLCMFIWSFCQLAFAQEFTILDAENREAVVNVAVFNRDKSRTALSDFKGKVDLSVFDPDERITFRHISYQTLRTTLAQLNRRKTPIYLFVKPEQLDEVVMSVSKWEQQKKDVPQKIASISAREIALNEPQTSADLLQQSGQVFVQKSQLGGGSPMIRGFATNRLLLSVDGVRMNNAIFRGGNIQNVISIDPYTVQSTEVIFGPGSVIYGSDAIGGVMNFLTRKALFANSDSLEVSGQVNLRTATANNEQSAHMRIGMGKKNWAFLSSASYNNFGDQVMGSHGPESYLRDQLVQTINGRDSVIANPEPRKQSPSAYEQLNLMQKISHRPNNQWRYDLGLYYSRTSDYPRYDRLIRPTSDGEGLRSAQWYYGPQQWFMGSFQLTQRGKSKLYDGLKATVAYQRFGESRNDRGFGDTELFNTTESVDALSANLDLENRQKGNLRLYYGAEYVFNKVGSSGMVTDISNGQQRGAASRYPDGSSWQTAAAYLNGEYKYRPNLTLLSGLRYSHVWLDAEFDTTYYPFPFRDANLNNGALTGSLGLSWFPREDLQITLNGATAFRSPNIDDIGKVFDSEPGSVVVPNPGLQPEYAYSVEAGVSRNFNDKLVLKGAAYYTYLDDALVRRDYLFNGQSQIEYNGELSNVQAIQNAARAYVYGLELGLQAFFTENLSLTSNLTLTEGKEEDDNGDESPARHVAPTFGDLHLQWKDPRLQADFFLIFNGEIANEDLATSEQDKTYIYAVDANGNPYAPAWYTLNWRSQYAISEAFKLSINLENITNQRYRPYSSGITGAGRNLIIGLGYSF